MQTTKSQQAGAQTQHSPGPWRIEDAGRNSGNVVRGELIDANEKHIADLIDTFLPKRWEADAKLIAASPDLLNALRRLVSAIHLHGDFPMGTSVIQDANKAIEKATDNSRLQPETKRDTTSRHFQYGHQ